MIMVANIPSAFWVLAQTHQKLEEEINKETAFTSAMNVLLGAD